MFSSSRSSSPVAPLPQPAITDLPDQLIALVFALLPVDTRLRCLEVCSGWHAVLSEPHLWRVCDLSSTSGVARRTPTLLRAALARAQGGLAELDLSGWSALPWGEVQAVAAASPQLLRLALCGLVWRNHSPALDLGRLRELQAAVPSLRLLACDVRCNGHEALALLAPSPLRLGILCVHCGDDEEGGGWRALTGEQVSGLASAAASHPSLRGLKLIAAPLNHQPALDALVAAAVQRRFSYLHLTACSLSPASQPALARLFASCPLTHFGVGNNYEPLLRGPEAAALCRAIAASRLRLLALDYLDFWGELPTALAAVRALAGHPTLEALFLWRNPVAACGRTQAAVGAALGALVAAPSALRFLDVGSCTLRDAAAGLFAGVGGGSRLRRLAAAHNQISEEVARNVVLPAARACPHLMEVLFEQYEIDALREAAAVARSRRPLDWPADEYVTGE